MLSGNRMLFREAGAQAPWRNRNRQVEAIGTRQSVRKLPFLLLVTPVARVDYDAAPGSITTPGTRDPQVTTRL